MGISSSQDKYIHSKGKKITGSCICVIPQSEVEILLLDTSSKIDSNLSPFDKIKKLEIVEIISVQRIKGTAKKKKKLSYSTLLI
jgi:hypothetical protein